MQNSPGAAAGWRRRRWWRPVSSGRTMSSPFSFRVYLLLFFLSFLLVFFCPLCCCYSFVRCVCPLVFSLQEKLPQLLWISFVCFLPCVILQCLRPSFCFSALFFFLLFSLVSLFLCICFSVCSFVGSTFSMAFSSFSKARGWPLFVRHVLGYWHTNPIR